MDPNPTILEGDRRLVGFSADFGGNIEKDDKRGGARGGRVVVGELQLLLLAVASQRRSIRSRGQNV